MSRYPVQRHPPLAPSEAALKLSQLINGYRNTQMLYVASSLGIADKLKDGAQGIADLAQAVGAHAPTLYRLMRALASLGIFSEDEQGKFGLTEMAELLQIAVPGSLRAEAIISGDPTLWHAWSDLLHTVQTGETAFEHQLGMPIWEYRSRHPEANTIANEYFTALTRGQTDAIVAAYDFSTCNTVMDVGGGQGGLIAAMLKANPSLRGVLFDQKHVVSNAPALLEQAGVADRCEIVGGDFFGTLPIGADAIMLKNILHDWNDDDAQIILRNCRNALSDDGRLLVIDGVIPRGNEPHPRKLMDIQMLAVAGGRERTEAEWRKIFSDAGFALTRVIPTAAVINIIEGKIS